MDYPQTRTQNFNLNQEKKWFSLPPPPLLEGRLLQPPSPALLMSGMTPLEENFYHSFVALTLKGG